MLHRCGQWPYNRLRGNRCDIWLARVDVEFQFDALFRRNALNQNSSNTAFLVHRGRCQTTTTSREIVRSDDEDKRPQRDSRTTDAKKKPRTSSHMWSILIGLKSRTGVGSSPFQP